MKYEICYEPFFHIIIHNIFGKKINKDILKEAMRNKKTFVHATTGRGIDKKFRSNSVSFYDTLYQNKRKKSCLIKNVEGLFSDNVKFRETLASSQYPLSEFLVTNTHETQVSRYGNAEQKYEFHIDRFSNNSRLITVVYYFHKEPQCWEGGQIEFTKSPIAIGVEVDKDSNKKLVTPQNDMMVIFGGNNAHRVLPTKSPKEFSKGRFSMNCWVGIA